MNSHEAISKGTPLRNPDSLGWADPRSIKTFLDNEGYSVWIDYEQVGGKKTLFEDIVEGIRNAKLMIACISNEYSRSDSCMKEFRFASNLKIPILMCTFGSANTKCEWRNTELGIISCLMTKEINFQLENPTAFQDMLHEVKALNIEPRNVSNTLLNEEILLKSEEKYKPEMQAYAELIELAQRKFLRQMASFSETVSSKPFPRLFIIDLVSGNNLLG